MARELQIRQVSGASSGREVTVREFPLLIGRSEQCQFRFDPQDDSKVSALHAEIRLEQNGTFHLVDLESRNGTFLNGDRVGAAVVLPERSVLEVGHGGPKIDILLREGGSGVSFGDVRRKTGHFGRPEADKPMVSTDDSMQAYTEPPSVEHAGGISQRVKPKSHAALFIMVAIVAAILLGALTYLS